MEFKTSAKNKETGKYEIMVGDYETKKAFVEDLRANRYAVTPYKVKPTAVYDAIVEFTDASTEAFKLCKTVGDAENFEKIQEEAFERKLNELCSCEEEQVVDQIIDELKEGETVLIIDNDNTAVIHTENKTAFLLVTVGNKKHEIGTSLLGYKDFKQFLSDIKGDYIRRKDRDIISYYIYEAKEV